MILHPHFDVNEQGHLTVGGADAVALAKEFGTPAYILDENVIRDNCRTYLRAARAAFGEDALPLYERARLIYERDLPAGDERSTIAHNYDVVFGSRHRDTMWGCAMTLSGKDAIVRFTDEENEVQESFTLKEIF